LLAAQPGTAEIFPALAGTLHVRAQVPRGVTSQDDPLSDALDPAP
jgi:hypothetical protein